MWTSSHSTPKGLVQITFSSSPSKALYPLSSQNCAPLKARARPLPVLLLLTLLRLQLENLEQTTHPAASYPSLRATPRQRPESCVVRDGDLRPRVNAAVSRIKNSKTSSTGQFSAPHHIQRTFLLRYTNITAKLSSEHRPILREAVQLLHDSTINRLSVYFWRDSAFLRFIADCAIISRHFFPMLRTISYLGCCS